MHSTLSALPREVRDTERTPKNVMVETGRVSRTLKEQRTSCGTFREKLAEQQMTAETALGS